MNALTRNGLGGGGPDDNNAQGGHLVAFDAGGQLITEPTTAAQYGYGKWRDDQLAPPITSEGADASEDGTGRGTPLAFHVTQDPISGDVAPAMGAGNGQGCSTIGVLTEPEVYQGHGSNVGPMGTLRNQDSVGGVPFTPYAEVESLAMRGREGGSQVESGGDKAFTLRAGDGGSSRSAALRVDSAVRRLTPRECERLQGFPPSLIWSENMNRDEFAAALLATGAVTVDTATGSVTVYRGSGGIRLAEPRIIKGSMCGGYLVASFRLGEQRRQLRFNRLVWIAEHGIPSADLCVCHRNDIKTDNRIANLYLATAAENSADAAATGCYPTGERNGRAKLTDVQRAQVMDDHRHGGVSLRVLAERYGVSKSRIGQIVQQQDWTDVPGTSDSARYRQLGNAVCCNVAEWQGHRIVAYEAQH